MVDLIQGDSGAICHLCTTSRNSGNDIAVIEEGFKIEKDYKTCLEIWQCIERGKIRYSNTSVKVNVINPSMKHLLCSSHCFTLNSVP